MRISTFATERSEFEILYWKGASDSLSEVELHFSPRLELACT